MHGTVARGREADKRAVAARPVRTTLTSVQPPSRAITPVTAEPTDARADAVAEAEAMAERHLARQAEVERVGTLVRWLDDAVRIPGTRFGVGLDALVGLLLPGAGDVITGVASLAVLTAAVRRGVPRVVLARMLLNVAIDVLGGMVPVVGDAFDVVWRSNVRNLALLERHQGELEPRARPGDYAVLAVAVGLTGLSLAAPIVLLVWILGLLGVG